MPRTRHLLIAALLTSATLCAQAQPSATSPQHTRSLAATCAACHGTDGKAVKDAGLIGLAGRDKDYLAAQLKAFRDGTRQATVMHQIAKGYTPEQLDQLAAYFAAQR